MSRMSQQSESRKAQRDPVLTRVFATIRPAHLAEALGVTPQAINLWTRVPDEHVARIAAITGISPRELRPDSYKRFLEWHQMMGGDKSGGDSARV